MSIRPYRKSKQKAALGKDGELLHFRPPFGDTMGSHIRFVDPEPFNAVLRFSHFQKTQYSVFMHWCDAFNEKRTFPMFLDDMEKTLKWCEFQSGNVIDGLWGYVTKGGAYGITPLLGHPDEKLEEAGVTL